MSFIFSALSEWINDDDSVLHRSVPILVLIVYSFSGAGIFYALEMSGSCTVDYWVSLWFVNTVITTIGYGNVVPCTDGGKIFTVIYALIGVPLTLVAFNNVGIIMIRPLAFLYGKCFEREKVDPSGKARRPTKFPLSLGLLLTLVWFFGASAYFSIFSENSTTRWAPYSSWAYAEALYYMFISITTIGFGDFYPTNFVFTAVHFIFIIVGLSLFSLCVNLVQEKVVDFAELVKKRIVELYTEAIQRGGGIEDLSIKSQIRKIKGGKLMYRFMGKGAKRDLQAKLDDLGSRRCKYTQTNWEMIDMAIQVNGGSGEQKTVICQTAKTFSPNAHW